MNNSREAIGDVQRQFPSVSAEESGQKLLRFLTARLELPASLLHRWIRTGQIRVNGRRYKPFSRIYENDIVRVPPFAAALIETAKSGNERTDAIIPDDIEILDEHLGIMFLEKPGGLPTQGGTGNLDSVAARLKKMFASSLYKPAPAHRLDKDTSGILLAGRTWEVQGRLQEAFARGLVHKEYLVWVKGAWPYPDELYRHFLYKDEKNFPEKTRVYEKEIPGSKPALTFVHPLVVEENRSLLQVRIFTGRKHQIRAQMAHLGFPVVGDAKYGMATGSILYLDAFRLILNDGYECARLPKWTGSWQVGTMPAPINDMNNIQFV